MNADTMTYTRPLAARMAAVMLAVQRLPKSGSNTQQGYRYVQDEDVLDTLRPLIAAEGLCILPAMERIEQSERGTRSGGMQTRTIAHFTFTILTDEGESRDFNWIAEADDSGDKGTGKAATYALKYWLLKTFLLSTGNLADDPDIGIERNRQRRDGSPQNRQQGQRPQSERPTRPAPAALWFSVPDEMKRAAAVTQPMTLSKAAEAMGKRLPDFASADAFITAWQAFNAPAKPAAPDHIADKGKMVTQPITTAKEQRAQMQGELVEITSITRYATKNGTIYYKGKAHDPNGVSLEVQFWREHIEMLGAAGWPTPEPDENAIWPETITFDEPCEIILTGDLRPAWIARATLPLESVRGSDLQAGDVLLRKQDIGHGIEFALLVNQAGKLRRVIIWHDSVEPPTLEALSIQILADEEYTRVDHPQAARLLAEHVSAGAA